MEDTRITHAVKILRELLADQDQMMDDCSGNIAAEIERALAILEGRSGASEGDWRLKGPVT